MNISTIIKFNSLGSFIIHFIQIMHTFFVVVGSIHVFLMYALFC